VKETPQPFHLGLANSMLGISFGVLALKWPGWHSGPALPLFFATALILGHWTFGIHFVLRQLGQSLRLGGTLLDCLVFMVLLALPLNLGSPLDWFILNCIAYAAAWLHYRGVPPQGVPPLVADYVRKKSMVEVGAVLANASGVALCWFLPALTESACWVTLGSNALAAWLCSDVWRLYDLAPLKLKKAK